jgi:lipopolysaccharide biosynthesis protein
VSKIRTIAFYLPQFHPIPENDAWWGKGFTEWSNVVKATPRFKGHYQPHLPSDLGFYDLRLPLIREQQAALAREYGIDGFCYYHYWFNGKRLLSRPLDDMRTSGSPTFPYMLCWANENWTRRWDGRDQEVLIAQRYSESDHVDHISFLCDTFFADSRYIRVENRPVFLVYRTELIPNVRRAAQIWRETAQDKGFDGLYLVAVESLTSDLSPEAIGFDASVRFQPSWKNLPPKEKPSFTSRCLDRLGIIQDVYSRNRILDYAKIVALALKHVPRYKTFECVVPMWDNSARRKEGATILVNSSPQLYREWLSAVVKRFQPFSPEENFIFINAWNEWAEGNHLEPCQKWGLSYLKATKSAIEGV